MASYPCSCVPISVSIPSCPSGGNCLRVASIVVAPANSVLPCGGSGSVSIGAASDLSACTTTVNWFLLPVSQGGYNDDAFESVSINSSGVLFFTTTTAISLDVYYRFIGKVTCSDTLLSQFFYVDVKVVNACAEIVCPDGETCYPCTGACIPDEDIPDVELF